MHGEGRNSDVKMAKGREPCEARLAGRAGWRAGANSTVQHGNFRVLGRAAREGVQRAVAAAAAVGSIAMRSL